MRSTYIALLLLAATLVAAQEPDTPTRFFIDAIAVEGVRYVSERVIIAETRLHAGREYTEAEIRAGAARAMRLPFVLRIEPRIEKGAQRGAYRLVLVVTETRPLFFGGTYIAQGGDDDPDVRQFTTGARMFLGRSGMLHGAATTNFEETLYEIGYTQYDLFGTGVFVAVAAEYGAEIPDASDGLYTGGTLDRITGQVVVGVPLHGNHALRATYLSAPVAVLTEPVRPLEPDEFVHLERSWTADVAWIYDSSDDPLFTTRGTRGVLSAGRREVPFFVIPQPATLPWRRTEDMHQWVAGDVRHVWSLAPRHSVSARLGDTYLRREIGEGGRLDIVNRAFAGTSYMYSIFGPENPWRFGDVRFESALVHQQTNYRLGDLSSGTLRQTSVRAGLLFRNEWGVVRLGFDVEHDHE